MCHTKNTHLWIQKFIPLRRDVKSDALHGAWKCDAADEQGQEYNVGKYGRDVGDLPAAGHALPEGEEEEDVAEGQAEREAPVRHPDPLVNGRGHFQHVVAATR